MLNIFLFVLYVVLSSSGLILFKLGALASNINLNIFGVAFSFSMKSVIGVLCYGFSFILWMVIVSRMNLTFAMPLSVAIVNTLVVIGSCLILKEKVTFVQVVGIFVIISGVCIMTIGKQT